MLMVKTLCPPKLALDKQNITSESFDSFSRTSIILSLSLFTSGIIPAVTGDYIYCVMTKAKTMTTHCAVLVLWWLAFFSLWLITSPHKGS